MRGGSGELRSDDRPRDANRIGEGLGANERGLYVNYAIDLKVGTKIDLYNAKEELEKSKSALASDQGQLIETDAALRSVRSEKAKTVSQFIADNENKLAEAARKADEARQALAKAEARLARTRLYAPTDGVVQQLAVTTVGQVVTTGQQLIVLTIATYCAPIRSTRRVGSLRPQAGLDPRSGDRVTPQRPDRSDHRRGAGARPYRR